MKQLVSHHTFSCLADMPNSPLTLSLAPTVRRHSDRSYVSDLKERLRFAYELARKNIKKSQIKNQPQYNKGAHAIVLEDGDRVNVRKLHRVSKNWPTDGKKRYT